MKDGVSPLERAFQLARSGQVAGVAEIKATLRREGYDGRSIEGPALYKQLRQLIEIARESGR